MNRHVKKPIQNWKKHGAGMPNPGKSVFPLNRLPGAAILRLKEASVVYASPRGDEVAGSTSEEDSRR